MSNDTSPLNASPLSLRPREAAKALGISERTLWTLTASGDVPHFKLGRATLYPVRELTDWLTAKTAAANSQGSAGDSEGGAA